MIARPTPRSTLIAVCAALLVVISAAEARDTRLRLPISEALNNANAKAQLDSSVKLFFGPQAHPKAAKSYGVVTTNKKTNFFNKSDKEGCEWAFLSAMLALQDRARREGGDAVVNIRSVYRGADLASETEYECGAGTMVGGVSFSGEIVKL